MFNFFRQAPKSSSPRRKNRPNHRLHSVQRLEERDLMSGTPLKSGPIDSIPHPPSGPNWSSAQPVELSHMPVRHVSEALTSSTDTDLFKVSLQAGDYLALDVDPLGAAPLGLKASQVTIMNSAGEMVATAGASLEPDTGVSTPHAAVGFRTSAADDYYIKVGTTAGNLGLYELNLHRLALAEGMQSGGELSQSGSMFAWLQGDMLELSGPTGYGFGIRGSWTEKTTAQAKSGLSTSTYSATGAMFLETAFGEVPLTVPSGQTFTVVTKANTYGGAFGEVASVTANVGLPLGNVGADLQAKLGLNLDSISLGNKWTIQMGSQVAAQRGITQALSAVPYLVYADKGAYRAQFGGVTVTNSAATGTVLMADPVDPMLYLRSGNFAFAGSLQGHVAYAPKFTPSVPVSPIFGHVFASGNFPIDGLPLTVRGDITLNLDANHDGLWLGGEENASQLFQHNSVSSEALSRIFADLQIGANGQVDAGYDAAGYHFTIPLGQASAVYNGPEQHIWFKGASLDPWKGTPLSQFQAVSTVSLEGSYRDPSAFDPAAKGADSGLKTNEPSPWFITATGTYKVMGMRADATLTLDDTGVTAAATARALGANVTLVGRVWSSGNFLLAGSADLSFGALHGSAEFELTKIGATKTFTAAVEAKAEWSATVAGVKWSTKAKIKGDLKININSSGALSYSGSITASGKVESSIGSISFDVSASVSSNKIVLSIPKIGTKSITLPTV